MSYEHREPTTDELELLMRKHAMTVGFSVLWGCFTATGVNGIKTESYMATTLVARVHGLDFQICGGPT